MQERRTTIRIPHDCGVQYCSSDELLPRDGRLLNLSENGVGLLAQEAHQDGEQLTVGVSFPGGADRWTATGIVRWSSASSLDGRWHPVGLTWLPLEEAARERLHQFLRQAPAPPSRSAHREVRLWSAVMILLVGGLCGAWVFSLQRENRQLQTVLAQRNSAVQQLEAKGASTHRALEAAKAELTSTTQEVARLDQQAKYLEGETLRLNQDVERFQQSYTQAREERETLMQRVLDLQQERLVQVRNAVPIHELTLAIREAIEARARTTPRSSTADRRVMRLQRSQGGNQGYIIHQGKPTISRSTMWVRVHEPEAAPSP